MKLLMSLCVMFLGCYAEARIFRNAYISFEMPETWKCFLEQTEWVCRSENNQSAKEAIIILTAKEVGPTDSFPLYRQHLDSPIAVTLRGGGSALSVVKYRAKDTKIDNQPWLDGLHLASEVPNYYTRYLVTIKDKIAILATFSVHKNFYQKYSQDFFRAVSSLRVIASKDLMNRPDLGPIRPGGELIGPPGSSFPRDFVIDEPVLPTRKSKKSIYVGLGLLLLAAGAYLYLKKGKKKS